MKLKQHFEKLTHGRMRCFAREFTCSEVVAGLLWATTALIIG